MLRFLAAAAGAALAAAQAPNYNCTGYAATGAFQPYVLRNSRGLEAHFIPYGATLTNFYVPDQNGVVRDVVLGFDDPSQYCANAVHPYFGAAIGRVANRIANCSFTLEGQVYNLPCNENSTGVPDTLHGGTIGYDRRQWDVLSYSDSSVTFGLFSPDGEMGFPGDLQVNVTYSLTDADNAWHLSWRALAGTKDTVVALTQHAYWNLNANILGTDNVLDHVLSMPTATGFLAVDAGLIPTGVVSNVSSAPWMDFTAPGGKAIGKDIARGTVTPVGGYDNAWVFDGWTPSSAGTPVPRITMSSPLTGISMTVSTDQPSVQFYSGNFLDGTIPRKRDQWYGPGPQYYAHWGAAALEAQHYPDAPHHPNFPSIVLPAGQTYMQETSYAFAVAGAGRR